MSDDNFVMDEEMQEELKRHNRLSIGSDPVGRILNSADSGSFFRAPLKAIFFIVGVFLLLGCLGIAFSQVSLKSAEKPSFCDRLDEVCKEYRYDWQCDERKTCERLSEMESRLKTPWFSVLGLILFGIAGARVLFIRGQQVSTENIPRFHVTPVLLHALKTNGDVAFFGFAILGIAAGFDAAVFEAQSDNETIAVFTGLGKAGIVAGPLMGFLAMLVHHTVAEFAGTFIATAESAVKTANHTEALTKIDD